MSTNPKPSRHPTHGRLPEPPPRTEKERLRLARERAQSYREGDPLAPAASNPPANPGAPDPIAIERALSPVEEEDRPETLEEWQDLVSRRVDDAMRRGVFDNLAGQGKPQSLQRDPFVPEEQQMAYNLMKKNQITPGWIGDRKAILAAIEDLRQEIHEFARAFWARAEQTQAVVERTRLAQQWDGCVVAWQERVDTLNGQILNLNLTQPFHYLEVYKLRLDEELKRVGATRHLPVE